MCEVRKVFVNVWVLYATSVRSVSLWLLYLAFLLTTETQRTERCTEMQQSGVRALNRFRLGHESIESVGDEAFREPGDERPDQEQCERHAIFGAGLFEKIFDLQHARSLGFVRSGSRSRSWTRIGAGDWSSSCSRYWLSFFRANSFDPWKDRTFQNSRGKQDEEQGSEDRSVKR